MLEKLRDMGTTVLETCDPPPLGDFNMADAKKRVGDDICFLGGVDSITIWKGTPKDVERLTRELIAEGAYGGGLIAGTGDSPPIGTPLVNMQALVKTAKKVGFYPRISACA
jgi:uroporphyrinogen-III decarboxylase